MVPRRMVSRALHTYESVWNDLYLIYVNDENYMHYVIYMPYVDYVLYVNINGDEYMDMFSNWWCCVNRWLLNEEWWKKLL